MFFKKYVYSTNVSEYLSITRVLHEKKCTRNSRLKQKSDFLIKKSYVRPLVLLLLPRMYPFDGIWGSNLPPYIRYWSLSREVIGIYQGKSYFTSKLLKIWSI